MRERRNVYWTIVLGAAVAFLFWWTISSIMGVTNNSGDTTASIVQIVSEEDSDLKFAKVARPSQISFPSDHGPHTDFRTEWWYFTGNLLTPDKTHFGYQFTIFRRAVSAEKPDLPSDWSTNQIYMAHIALTDPKEGDFYSEERFSREALDMAGAQLDPLRVWLDDWVMEGVPGNCNGCLDIQIHARAKNFALSLNLTSLKPAVLHGENGYSRKGAGPDNASYYYSLTRMGTKGQVVLNEQEFSVSGTSWMDHEWFTSVLDANQAGWNWFSIQLEDGRDIMFFELRRENGDATEFFNEGTLVNPQGDWIRLSMQDVKLTKLRTWKSEKSGSEYPVDWKMEIPKHNLSLTLKAVIDNQERIDSLKYWEGAINVTEQEDSKKLVGRGYIEMTGY